MANLIGYNIVIVADSIGYNNRYNISTFEADVCIGYNTHLPDTVFIVADVKISLNC